MKRSPLKRRSKTPRAKATARADAAWSLNVRHRAGNRCEVCGRPDTLQAHHIRPRTYMRSRWERLNGVCLCWQHHKQFAHGDAPGFLSWLRVASPDRYEFALDPFRTEPIQRPIGDIIDIAVSLELDNKLYEAEAA